MGVHGQQAPQEYGAQHGEAQGVDAACIVKNGKAQGGGADGRKQGDLVYRKNFILGYFWPLQSLIQKHVQKPGFYALIGPEMQFLCTTTTSNRLGNPVSMC